MVRCCGVEVLRYVISALTFAVAEVSYKYNLISDVIKNDVERYRTLSENSKQKDNTQEISQLEDELTNCGRKEPLWGTN